MESVYYKRGDFTVTIKDVARYANVSPSTVSRVIKGNKKISLATIQKVQTAMDELNYFPNQAARTLITKKTNTIGLIFKSETNLLRQNPFYNDVITGISNTCNQFNYATNTTVSNNEEDLLKEVQYFIDSKKVDGFILLYSKENNPIFQLLVNLGIPFVVIGKNYNKNDVIHIDNDNIEAAYKLTDWLILQGYQDILFLSEKGNYAVSADRTIGYQQAMIDASLYPKVHNISNQRLDLQQFVKYLLCLQQLPHAIITSDAMLNLHLLSVLYDNHVFIPKDIGTATFNYSFITESASPPQTCININTECLGQTAATQIINLLAQQQVSNVENQNIYIPTSIIQRQSTQINIKE
ncbi:MULTISPECIES: LacI family DNA-binding transcriptional regulator [Staphylococcus]|uniref:LacI family DNA-binding transcriptional regulator n=1 Tax=Staphylococcus TaxID=1279 RepID=UPI0015625ABA|nr:MULTISPECIES: LacI family DNA-binding transcriptional regulator [unclassified Staphylococcus]MDU0965233.1 LacI family DNA-binding transcriptional regulator [Staphylococcus lugdunensis]MDU2404938.1 LacI family DNA-binding transcriptional regulator [Staphylococcus lugdunensis]